MNIGSGVLITKQVNKISRPLMYSFIHSFSTDFLRVSCLLDINTLLACQQITSKILSGLVEYHGRSRAGRCDGEEWIGGANLDRVVRKGFLKEGTVAWMTRRKPYGDRRTASSRQKEWYFQQTSQQVQRS